MARLITTKVCQLPSWGYSPPLRKQQEVLEVELEVEVEETQVAKGVWNYLWV
jgi:hypothetical protein